MNEPYAIADRVEIEALRAEFTDAVVMRDYDRFASLFTDAGAWRMPHINVEFVSRQESRAAIERLQGRWEYFVHHPHAGTIRIEGNSAFGRSYVEEFGRMRDGSSNWNYAVYHDRYERTPDGWKFAERVYEVLYVDDTPRHAAQLAAACPSASTAGFRRRLPPSISSRSRSVRNAPVSGVRLSGRPRSSSASPTSRAVDPQRR
jgi:ketosteroid isomerase-like protein